ncbi:MAG: T9SS type A sorting domain-containing protein [Cyclobacteriaceae bacterium]
MRKVFFGLALCIFFQGSSQEERPIGVNLTDLSPFGTVWIYTNALKQSSGWLVRNANDEADPVNGSSELRAELFEAFDSVGYPLEVPFQSNHPQTMGKTLEVSCLVLNGQPAPYFYPSGNYLLIYEGQGSIVVQGDIDGGAMIFNVGGTYEVPVSNPTSLGLELIITSSLEADPVRNVQLIFPEYVDNYSSEKFRSDFIELVQSFDVLRFMKPLRVENNTVVDWSDRTTSYSFSYYLDVENQVLPGMPYSEIIELSNLTGTDPWICVPHMASDEYVDSLALLFHDNLEEERRVYVEYSNEAWNPAYPEKWQYMLDQGVLLNLATSTNEELAELEAIHRFYTKRSFEIFQIFNDTYLNADRVVRVHATQSDPFVADLIFDAYNLPSVNPNNLMPDAVAIASYIGVSMFDDFQVQNLEVCDHTAQELLDTLRMRINNEMIGLLERYATLSNERGIDLFAYEGGQHVTELNFQPMESCAEELVATMNRLPEMEDFFCEVFETWYETLDGELFMIFNLAERPDPFGSFGIFESQFQEVTTSNKWSGVERCGLFSVPLAVDPGKADILLFPNPTNGMISIRFQQRGEGEIRLLNLAGQLIYKRNVKDAEEIRINQPELVPGIYLIEWRTKVDIIRRKIKVQK